MLDNAIIQHFNTPSALQGWSDITDSPSEISNWNMNFSLFCCLPIFVLVPSILGTNTAQAQHVEFTQGAPRSLRFVVRGITQSSADLPGEHHDDSNCYSPASHGNVLHAGEQNENGEGHHSGNLENKQRIRHSNAKPTFKGSPRSSPKEPLQVRSGDSSRQSSPPPPTAVSRTLDRDEKRHLLHLVSKSIDKTANRKGRAYEHHVRLAQKYAKTTASDLRRFARQPSSSPFYAKAKGALSDDNEARKQFIKVEQKWHNYERARDSKIAMQDLLHHIVPKAQK